MKARTPSSGSTPRVEKAARLRYGHGMAWHGIGKALAAIAATRGTHLRNATLTSQTKAPKNSTAYSVVLVV